mmetsp:Transcript_7467/g.15333  ORF Transcript_7467/g.15333 Transcript_7467/m.15333 type:complete len:236 (-) Transcript_7467:675-1382(-)
MLPTSLPAAVEAAAADTASVTLLCLFLVAAAARRRISPGWGKDGGEGATWPLPSPIEAVEGWVSNRASMASRASGWCARRACCTRALMAALQRAPAQAKARCLKRGRNVWPQPEGAAVAAAAASTELAAGREGGGGLVRGSTAVPAEFSSLSVRSTGMESTTPPSTVLKLRSKKRSRGFKQRARAPMAPHSRKAHRLRSLPYARLRRHPPHATLRATATFKARLSSCSCSSVSSG